MPDRGLFITATDTGVGKTAVTAALVAVLREDGRSVCAMKPIESGCREEGGRLVPADGELLQKASGATEPIEAITPVCLREPLAPSVAAAMEDTEVDTELLKERFKTLAGRYETVLVEGIGGLMVPIKPGYFVADMARDFGLPLLVVASIALGTINHTLLTVRAAERAGLNVAGVVLNHHALPTLSIAERTNPAELEKLLDVPLLGVMPFVPGLDPTALAHAVRENLNLDAIKSFL